jgi:hypothetical protein
VVPKRSSKSNKRSRTNTGMRREKETQVKVAEAMATIATTVETVVVAITTTIEIEETASRVVVATETIAIEMPVSKRPTDIKRRTPKEVEAHMVRAAERIETNADQLTSKRAKKFLPKSSLRLMTKRWVNNSIRTSRITPARCLSIAMSQRRKLKTPRQRLKTKNLI